MLDDAGRKRLAAYVKERARQSPDGNMSSAYREFVDQVRMSGLYTKKQLSGKRSPIASMETLRRWREEEPKYLLDESVKQIAIWRKETTDETKLWLLGSPQQSANGVTLNAVIKFIQEHDLTFAMVWEIMDVALERMGKIQRLQVDEVLEPEAPEKKREKKILSPQTTWALLGKLRTLGHEKMGSAEFQNKKGVRKEIIEAFVAGEEIEIYPDEFVMLVLLASHPGLESKIASELLCPGWEEKFPEAADSIRKTKSKT